jgi:putative ABC transport system permease protein
LSLADSRQGFFYLLRDMIGLKVPAASLRPFLIGGVTAWVCLITFALPPLWALRKVSPLRVLRDDLQHSLAASNGSYALGLIGLTCLLIWYSRDIFAASAMLVGGALIFVLVGAMAYWLLKAVQIVGMQAGSVWRLGVANLQRRLYANALQVVIFSLTFMLVLMLALVRTSLIAEWRMQIPQGTPNHFFINIAPQQMPEVENYLQQHQVTTAGLYPMVRGRLVELNDVSVATLFADKRIEGLDRELNLSWSKTIPQQNTIVAGRWWDDTPLQNNPASQYPPVSIEQDFAERMELKLGDKLTFTIADQKITAEIASIRALRWDGMKPNFYIIFPPNVLNDLPATYITSFYLSAAQKELINSVAKKFPAITVIELDPIIKRVDAIIDQVSLAVEIVLVLIVISGVLVLIASVQATMDIRYHENAILRTLGASAQLILGSLTIEFITLGLLAGILAAAGAELVAFLVQTQVFEMSFQLHYWLWLAGPLLGMTVVTAVGIAFSYKVTRVSPLQVLRSI